MSDHPPIVISIKHHTEPWIVFHAQNAAHAKDLLGESFSDADVVFRDNGDLVRGILAAQNQYRGRADKAVQYYAEKNLHDAGAVQAEPGGYDASGGGYSDVPAQQSRYDNQSGGGYQQSAPQQNAPAQRSYGAGAAAPSNGQSCQHGERTYRKTDRYEALFCNAAKGDPTQCPPLFKDKRTGAWAPPKTPR